jgi:hypothetical protein
VGNCKTCRFMAAPRDGYESFAVEETEQHGTCTRIIHGNPAAVERDWVLTAPAVVTDGSGYAARLKVLPSFGCVLHETKGVTA